MQYYHKNEKCSFSVEDEYDFTSHHDEINTAYFLYHLYGGHMVVLKESNALYQKTPDYLWNGKFWELKTISSEKSVDSAIRSALQQIKDNPGGIILSYMNVRCCFDMLSSILVHRLLRSKIQFTLDIILIHTEIHVFHYECKE